MTNEELLNQLNSTNPFMKGANYEAVKDYITSLQRCVEKQIPKKPRKETIVTVIKKDGSINNYIKCYCPSCYKYEYRKNWKRKVVFDQEYCEVCGTKLDWSDEE